MGSHKRDGAAFRLASGRSVFTGIDGQDHPIDEIDQDIESPTFTRILDELTGFGLLTKSGLGKAVGVGERTVHNWATGASAPTGKKAQRLLDVEFIVRQLSSTYTREGIKIWLNSRNRNLELRRPIDLLESGDIDTVLDEASRISGGM